MGAVLYMHPRVFTCARVRVGRRCACMHMCWRMRVRERVYMQVIVQVCACAFVCACLRVIDCAHARLRGCVRKC